MSKQFTSFISVLIKVMTLVWLPPNESSSSNWIGEFVHAVPLHWPHAGEHSRPCLRQVHLALAQSDDRSYTLSSAEATPVRLVGQSSEGVPALPSPSIYSPPMTCLRFCLSIASPATTISSNVEGELKTFACSLKCNELAYFFKAAASPMPCTREVRGVASQNGVKK